MWFNPFYQLQSSQSECGNYFSEAIGALSKILQGLLWIKLTCNGMLSVSSTDPIWVLTLKSFRFVQVYNLLLKLFQYK